MVLKDGCFENRRCFVRHFPEKLHTDCFEYSTD